MKKKLVARKLTAVILAAAMVLATGCGDTAGESGQTPQEGSSSSTESSAEQSEEQDGSSEQAAGSGESGEAGAEGGTEEEPKYDFGGRVVRIGAHFDMAPDPTKSALEAALAERIAFVEENYNCTIEFVNLGDDNYNQYVTSVLAGEPVVDIAHAVTSRVLPSLIEGGIVYPVSDLESIDLTDYKWRADVTEAGHYKGKDYAFLLKDPEIRYGIFWNKTLFEKYNLPDLYELVDNDEWTWEKFKEIAIAGSQDTDNDGKVDIDGFAAWENLAWCYIYSNGVQVTEKTDSGLTVDMSDPRVLEALTALQDFTTTVDYRDTIDWSTENWDAMVTGFCGGESMMLLAEYWVAYTYMTADRVLYDEINKMTDEWGWVPFPKGPAAEDWSCYGKENGCRIMLNGIDDPEEVALIYDLITDLADTDEEWDELMTDLLTSWADDAKTVELVSYIYDNKINILNSLTGYTDLNKTVDEMFSKVQSGELTPQTALDTYQSQIEAGLADLENHDYEAEMQGYVKTEEEGGEE